jgi:hypothetical protein
MLDRTYNRMLEIIDSIYRQPTICALIWLAFAEGSLDIEELAEAAKIDLESDPILNPDDRFLDPSKYILNVLRSFIIMVPQYLDDASADTESHSLSNVPSEANTEYAVSPSDTESRAQSHINIRLTNYSMNKDRADLELLADGSSDVGMEIAVPYSVTSSSFSTQVPVKARLAHFSMKELLVSRGISLFGNIAGLQIMQDYKMA